MAATRIAYYVDCPTDGEGALAGFNGAYYYCSTCKATMWGALQHWPYDGRAPYLSDEVRISKPRKIEIRNPGYTGDRSACKPICTSGKRSCDCRCMGKCHGAGRCLGGHS